MSTAAPSKKGQSRNLSMDLLKGISILMVVFFHNMRLNPESFADNLWMLACNAAVPCFFLVSGALFFSRPFDLKRHILRILRTYLALVAWRGIYILFYGVYLGAGTGGSLRAFLSCLLVFQSIDGIPTALFWFMEAMLVVLLLAPLLWQCRRTDRRLILYLMAVLVLFNQLLTGSQFVITLLSGLAGRSVWNITSFGQISPVNNAYSLYVLYFLLGAELWDHKDILLAPSLRIAAEEAKKQRARGSAEAAAAGQSAESHSAITAAGQPAGSSAAATAASPRRSAKIPAALMAAGLCGMLLIKYLQSGTFLWNNTHIVSGYYWFSTMALACGMFLAACLLPEKPAAPVRFFARTIGASTIGIFYLHTPLISLLTAPLFLHLDPLNGWLMNLAESFLMASIACLITWAGRKIPLIRMLF